jgi:hypothetical protein
MTDRELLELAAKAAAMPDGSWYCEHHDGRGKYWNPLADDGDALRLAVNLSLSIDLALCTTSVYRHDIKSVTETEMLDPCAATRRAIVRAAVEVGRVEP